MRQQAGRRLRHGGQCLRVEVRQHPDRLIGFRYLRLGRHPLQDVDLAVEEGFRGLKFTIPLRPYDHESYLPVYERAQAYGLPCLFHTGIVTTKQHLAGVSSAHMRPLHLDTVAHQFPRLRLICAHLGMPWYDEARPSLPPNVYVDSAALLRWRPRRTFVLPQPFYWPDAWRKIIGAQTCITAISNRPPARPGPGRQPRLSADQRSAYFGGNLLSCCLLPDRKGPRSGALIWLTSQIAPTILPA